MEQNKGRGAGVWILLMILLLLWNIGALAVGGVLRILAGLRGSEKTTSEKPGVSMTDAVQTGEVSVRFDEAVHWTVSSDFASEGFTYAQIWVTLENTGSGAIESPDPACFFVEYDGEVPGWMHDWQRVYGDDYLRQTFGADDRSNIMGEVTENAAYYDEDYYDEPRTLAPGERVTVYRLYQVPEGTEDVTVLYFASLEDAKADKAPLLRETLPLSDARMHLPEEQVRRYDDPEQAARERSTYKRPDKGDLDTAMDDYQDADDCRAFAMRNGRAIVQGAALCGGWIGQLTDHDAGKEHYCNAKLEIAQDDTATLTIDWYAYYDEDAGATSDESARPDSVYTGRFAENSTLEVTDGTDTIRIYTFIECNDGITQEAFGHFIRAGQEEDPNTYPFCSFCLIRPERYNISWMDPGFIAELDGQITYSDLAPADYVPCYTPGAAPSAEPETTQPTSTEKPTAATSTDVPQGLEGGDVPQGLEGGDVPQGLEGGDVPQGLEGGDVPQGLEGGDIPQGLEGGDVPQGGISVPYSGSPGRPSLTDFDWIGQPAPTGARYLDSYEWLGEWKGMFLYDESTRDLVNVLIDIGQSGDILLTVDWYQLAINGEPPSDETGYEDTVYSGYEWGAGIRVTGTGVLDIDEFYAVGGTQYATGTLTVDGRAYPAYFTR